MAIESLNQRELAVLRFLAKNLKYIRRNLLRATAEMVSKNTGVSRDVILRLETWADKVPNSRMAYPSLTTILRLGDGYGVTPGVLFDLDIEKSVPIQQKIFEFCNRNWKTPERSSDELLMF